MMRQMLQWRKDNGVDAIREDIMQNRKFHPRYVLRRSATSSYACVGVLTATCVAFPTHVVVFACPPHHTKYIPVCGSGVLACFPCFPELPPKGR